jgi:hypothetical protein
LYLVYKSLKARIGDKGGTVLMDVAFMLSIILSFSLFGYAFIVVLLLFLGSRVPLRIAIPVAAGVLLIAFFVAGPYIADRISLGDASGTGLRREGWRIFRDDLDVGTLLLGWGFTSDLRGRFGEITFGDLGFLATTMMFSGLPAVAWLSTLVVVPRRHVRWEEWCLAVVVFLSKLALSYLLLWFFLAYIVLARQMPSTVDRGASPAPKKAGMC